MYLCCQFGPLSDVRCAGCRMVGAKRDAASERQMRDKDRRRKQDEGARGTVTAVGKDTMDACTV